MHHSLSRSGSVDAEGKIMATHPQLPSEEDAFIYRSHEIEVHPTLRYPRRHFESNTPFNYYVERATNAPESFVSPKNQGTYASQELVPNYLQRTQECLSSVNMERLISKLELRSDSKFSAETAPDIPTSNSLKRRREARDKVRPSLSSSPTSTSSTSLACCTSPDAEKDSRRSPAPAQSNKRRLIFVHYRGRPGIIPRHVLKRAAPAAVEAAAKSEESAKAATRLTDTEHPFLKGFKKQPEKGSAHDLYSNERSSPVRFECGGEVVCPPESSNEPITTESGPDALPPLLVNEDESVDTTGTRNAVPPILLECSGETVMHRCKQVQTNPCLVLPQNTIESSAQTSRGGKDGVATPPEIPPRPHGSGTLAPQRLKKKQISRTVNRKTGSSVTDLLQHEKVRRVREEVAKRNVTKMHHNKMNLIPSRENLLGFSSTVLVGPPNLSKSSFLTRPGRRKMHATANKSRVYRKAVPKQPPLPGTCKKNMFQPDDTVDPVMSEHANNNHAIIQPRVQEQISREYPMKNNQLPGKPSNINTVSNEERAGVNDSTKQIFSRGANIIEMEPIGSRIATPQAKKIPSQIKMDETQNVARNSTLPTKSFRSHSEVIKLTPHTSKIGDMKKGFESQNDRATSGRENKREPNQGNLLQQVSSFLDKGGVAEPPPKATQSSIREVPHLPMLQHSKPAATPQKVVAGAHPTQATESIKTRSVQKQNLKPRASEPKFSGIFPQPLKDSDRLKHKSPINLRKNVGSEPVPTSPKTSDTVVKLEGFMRTPMPRLLPNAGEMLRHGARSTGTRDPRLIKPDCYTRFAKDTVLTMPGVPLNIKQSDDFGSFSQEVASTLAGSENSGNTGIENSRKCSFQNMPSTFLTKEITSGNTVHVENVSTPIERHSIQRKTNATPQYLENQSRQVFSPTKGDSTKSCALKNKLQAPMRIPPNRLLLSQHKGDELSMDQKGSPSIEDWNRNRTNEVQTTTKFQPKLASSEERSNPQNEREISKACRTSKLSADSKRSSATRESSGFKQGVGPTKACSAQAAKHNTRFTASKDATVSLPTSRDIKRGRKRFSSEVGYDMMTHSTDIASPQILQYAKVNAKDVQNLIKRSGRDSDVQVACSNVATLATKNYDRKEVRVQKPTPNVVRRSASEMTRKFTGSPFKNRMREGNKQVVSENNVILPPLGKVREVALSGLERSDKSVRSFTDQEPNVGEEVSKRQIYPRDPNSFEEDNNLFDRPQSDQSKLFDPYFDKVCAFSSTQANVNAQIQKSKQQVAISHGRRRNVTCSPKEFRRPLESTRKEDIRPLNKNSNDPKKTLPLEGAKNSKSNKDISTAGRSSSVTREPSLVKSPPETYVDYETNRDFKRPFGGVVMPQRVEIVGSPPKDLMSPVFGMHGHSSQNKTEGEEILEVSENRMPRERSENDSGMQRIKTDMPFANDGNQPFKPRYENVPFLLERNISNQNADDSTSLMQNLTNKHHIFGPQNVNAARTASTVSPMKPHIHMEFRRQGLTAPPIHQRQSAHANIRDERNTVKSNVPSPMYLSVRWSSTEDRNVHRADNPSEQCGTNSGSASASATMSDKEFEDNARASSISTTPFIDPLRNSLLSASQPVHSMPVTSELCKPTSKPTSGTDRKGVTPIPHTPHGAQSGNPSQSYIPHERQRLEDQKVSKQQQYTVYNIQSKGQKITEQKRKWFWPVHSQRIGAIGKARRLMMEQPAPTVRNRLSGKKESDPFKKSRSPMKVKQQIPFRLVQCVRKRSRKPSSIMPPCLVETAVQTARGIESDACREVTEVSVQTSRGFQAHEPDTQGSECENHELKVTSRQTNNTSQGFTWSSLAPKLAFASKNAVSYKMGTAQPEWLPQLVQQIRGYANTYMQRNSSSSPEREQTSTSVTKTSEENLRKNYTQDENSKYEQENANEKKTEQELSQTNQHTSFPLVPLQPEAPRESETNCLFSVVGNRETSSPQRVGKEGIFKKRLAPGRDSQDSGRSGSTGLSSGANRPTPRGSAGQVEQCHKTTKKQSKQHRINSPGPKCFHFEMETARNRPQMYGNFSSNNTNVSLQRLKKNKKCQSPMTTRRMDRGQVCVTMQSGPNSCYKRARHFSSRSKYFSSAHSNKRASGFRRRKTNQQKVSSGTHRQKSHRKSLHYGKTVDSNLNTSFILPHNRTTHFLYSGPTFQTIVRPPGWRTNEHMGNKAARSMSIGAPNRRLNSNMSAGSIPHISEPNDNHVIVRPRRSYYGRLCPSSPNLTDLNRDMDW